MPAGGERRALVTGAAGFIGANVVRRLVRDGHRVFALDRPGGDSWRLEGVREEAQVVEADLRDPVAIKAALRQVRPDWVFHLAAHGAYSWQRNTRGIMESALLGTVALVDGLVEVGCEALVHSGTSSEYGFKDHPPAETEVVEPNSPYAVAKAAGTMYCALAARTHGLRTSTLRLYSVYGPWEDPRRLVPKLIVRGMRSELPDLVDPSTARDFVFVDDAVDAFLLAVEGAPAGAVYNIGSGEQTRLDQLVEIAREEWDISAEPRWGSAEARSWDTANWVSDPRLAAAEIGWRPHIGLAEGLSNTAEWLRAAPELWGRYGVEA
jgi:UDP-glucose 4-epimerase